MARLLLRPAAVIVPAGACVSVMGCSEPPPPVPTSIQLTLIDGRVWTGDPTEPWIGTACAPRPPVGRMASGCEVTIGTSVCGVGRFPTGRGSTR
ncbi:MAG: hypothetical protein O3A25_05560 [Acidobacteria bacterium]|nr:hypothetical protein [Acidobacteriota bacterium]